MRRALILPVALILSLASLAAPAHAQTQPHVTVTVTGPTAVYAGQRATFDVTIDVDGERSDVYLTWAGAGSSVGPGGLCCEYIDSPVVSGSAQVVGSQIGSVRLSVEGPRTVLRLVLELYDLQPAPQLLVSAYLPGTNVAQYETVNPWKSIVSTTPLPDTGGWPSGDTSLPLTPFAAGAAMLLLSAACYSVALRRRTV
jgi:hypothetical protein